MCRRECGIRLKYFLFVCLRVCEGIFVYVRVYIFGYVRVHIFVYVRVYIFVYVRVYIFCVCKSVYILYASMCIRRECVHFLMQI